MEMCIIVVLYKMHQVSLYHQKKIKTYIQLKKGIYFSRVHQKLLMK